MLEKLKSYFLKRQKVFLFLFLFVSPFFCFSQTATIKGTIKDSKNEPIHLADIVIESLSTGVSSDQYGKFEISVPANTNLTVKFSFVGYKTVVKTLYLKSGDISTQNIVLEDDYQVLEGVDVTDAGLISSTWVRIDPTISHTLPTVGGFEDMLKSLPQVSSNNELSSQYNVRGGNFDENLVFVNDVEIYRPMLIRSGNQEGMSFINPDMVSSVTFSAGGFESKYGDKMSSVLDIKYKKPSKFGATAYLSLLGAGAQIEGASKNKKFTFNSGFRYKTTRYLLMTLDKAGTYDPNFLDFQAYMTYDVTPKYEISVLGNISNNSYKFIPESLKESWGTFNSSIGISMYFDGQEVDKFTNATAALIHTVKVNNNFKLKFLTSYYHTSEKETFDILTQYYLNEMNMDIGKGKSDSLVCIGIGSLLDHARNSYMANVLSFKHIGTYVIRGNHLEWGLQYNFEDLIYNVREWHMKDSAGYSLPRDHNRVLMYETDFANIKERFNRISAYIQDNYVFHLKRSDISINGGVRLNYLDFNEEFLVAPRLNIALKPDWKKKERNIIFRLSTGLYHQTPSLKEVRTLDGTINRKINSQSAVHVVLASDWDFAVSSRQFKFTTEIFYKYLYNLNPYSIDNVRIKYYGDNISKGFAYGIEAKINGEFVKNTQSWFSIALMQTKERIENAYILRLNDAGDVYRVDISDSLVSRPSEQLVNFGIYFQDYIPKAPTWQVSLSLLFGTSLRVTSLNKEKSQQEGVQYMSSKLRPYRRVDLGISKQFVTPARPLPKGNIFRKFKELWVSLEIFNLLDINNQISTTWVTATDGYQYGVPNYLTGRRINLKIIAKF